MIKSLLVALLEVRSYLRDKADLAFSLLLPIVVFALMYGAFGGQSLFHGTAHVVNEDQGGTYAARLIEELDKLDNLDVELLSRPEADSKLERANLLLVLYIPQGFSAKLTAGEPAQLVFEQRGNGGEEGQIVASLVRGVAEELGRELQVQSQVKNALAEWNISQGRIEITVQEFMERERAHPVVGVREETVGSSPDPVKQFLPGIVTMFVLFAITLTAKTVVEERKNGTLERLLTTRISVGQLFMGKFLANISRGFIQTLILLTLAYIVFQIFTPFSFAQSLVLALIFAAAASALGLVIASIVRTEDQATWIAVAFTMVMVMLGGTFFDITEGSVLATISRVSINTYANDAFKMIIAQGGSLADLGLELAVLGGVAAGGLGLSRLLFKVAPGGR
jgi:ABC-type multidrug transport system permease subunit